MIIIKKTVHENVFSDTYFLTRMLLALYFVVAFLGIDRLIESGKVLGLN